MAVSAVLDGMYDHIKIEGQKSYAKLALLFKTSKTSIFRQIKQIKSRTEIKGSTFFETEEGQQWLYQFIIICILWRVLSSKQNYSSQTHIFGYSKLKNYFFSLFF